ncbi:ATP-dependent zinc metalloprotease FtsH [Ottowia sp.]|uniref:ATP-dependent zinc metalloprotease FtsH n=1 Tax=Ottowia sp. TaxID=1898956 RepID=UPI002CEA7773|nr:ATP-dependent zinc metalloprotease FtsH [Ottowia sp.]HRN74981.1 ATP-dependent zinc metalloprotease FtsH [Ottowia sp.]HRQ02086.1 ATP-dependent zinc metalloprotease FtsH [Ottowia sp.]
MPSKPDPKTQWNVGYWLIALLALFVLQTVWQARTIEPVPFSEFEQALAEQRVAEVVIGDTTITGRLKNPDAGKTVIVANRVDVATSEWLDRYKVPYSRAIESTWLRDLLSWILPAVIFFGLWFFLIRRFAERAGGGIGGFMSIGKSRAKVYVEQNTGVTFADVAGVDEAKAELQEIIAFLKDPQGYGRLGARMPKGVLLVGPPGTGKTLLAKAVAGEAVVPFFSISGSEFVEMFVGVGAARVRDLFEQARAKAPAIIFIDELDALGRARGAGGMVGGHDEREQTLQQLLVELDGFDSSSGVVLLAATNRPEILDPALLRAGRFDRQVLVDRPDKAGRVQILQVHVKKIRLAPGVDLEQVAALTTGFSGADLANLCNEAALAATRRGATEVTLQDFTVAIERIVAGLEKRNRVLSPHEREIVAFHEIGHALVALALPGTDPVHKVSIIPRGIGALGYTLQRPTEDRFLMTREELERRIMVLLGGRASEKLVFGHLSTGAADDLAKATDIARDMVTRYGMDEVLGYVAFEAQRPRFLDVPGYPAPGGCNVSPQTQQHIDSAVRGIVMNAFDAATRLLERHRAVLDRAARELLVKETLDEAALTALTAGVRPAAADERA